MAAWPASPVLGDVGAALARVLRGRVVIVGVGNRDRGDDAFGPLVIDALQGRIDDVLIDAGVAPENHLHKIAALRPGVVLFVDAAALGMPPGELALYPGEYLDVGGLSTHTGSLSLADAYLRTTGGCTTYALLVEAARSGIGGAERARPSSGLRGAVARAAGLIEAVRKRGT
jgi:hydrogenase 3 maturation protease